jgi:hypothetical protein
MDQGGCGDSREFKGIRKRRKGFDLDLLPNKHTHRRCASGFHMIQHHARGPGDVVVRRLARNVQP